MLTFYLLRHGRTENNTKAIIMGGEIDTPLTKEGLKNANVLAKHLHKIKFDTIYSSDLGRAFITAHIIAEQLKLESKLIPSKKLREIDYGVFTHKLKEEVKKACPAYKTDAKYVFPNGESFYQMQKRVINFIKSLEKKHPNKTILIIAHAGIIRGIKCYFKELDLQEHLHMRISHEYIGKYKIDEGKLKTYKTLHE